MGLNCSSSSSCHSFQDLNVPLQLHQITRFLSTFGRAKQWQSALRLMEVSWWIFEFCCVGDFFTFWNRGQITFNHPETNVAGWNIPIFKSGNTSSFRGPHFPASHVSLLEGNHHIENMFYSNHQTSNSQSQIHWSGPVFGQKIGLLPQKERIVFQPPISRGYISFREVIPFIPFKLGQIKHSFSISFLSWVRTSNCCFKKSPLTKIPMILTTFF